MSSQGLRGPQQIDVQTVEGFVRTSHLDTESWTDSADQPSSTTQVVSSKAKLSTLRQHRYVHQNVRQLKSTSDLLMKQGFASSQYGDTQTTPIKQASAIQNGYYQRHNQVLTHQETPTSAYSRQYLPAYPQLEHTKFQQLVPSYGTAKFPLNHGVRSPAFLRQYLSANPQPDQRPSYQRRAPSNGSSDNDEVTSTTISPSSMFSHYYYNKQIQMHRMNRRPTRYYNNNSYPPTLLNTTDKNNPYKVVFTTEQIIVLEKAYAKRAYISSKDSQILSQQLNISDKCIKTWFNIRRTKEKIQRKRADNLRCVQFSRELEYVDSLIEKPNEYGLVTLDNRAVAVLCMAIADCLYNYNELCESSGSSTGYVTDTSDDCDHSSPLSSPISEGEDTWVHPHDQESINRLYSLHFC